MTVAAQPLPFVDVHSIEINALPAASWEALLCTVERSLGGGGAPSLARLLGCAEVSASGPRPLAEGSTVPGFRVAAARAPAELALAGGHRFSDYALVFQLQPLGEGRTGLRAETRAAFPGLRGRVYRTLVIGTRGHVLATRRILRAVKRRAERP